jgi:hypothetical protein
MSHEYCPQASKTAIYLQAEQYRSVRRLKAPHCQAAMLHRVGQEETTLCRIIWTSRNAVLPWTGACLGMLRLHHVCLLHRARSGLNCVHALVAQILRDLVAPCAMPVWWLDRQGHLSAAETVSAKVQDSINNFHIQIKRV